MTYKLLYRNSTIYTYIVKCRLMKEQGLQISTIICLIILTKFKDLIWILKCEPLN